MMLRFRSRVVHDHPPTQTDVTTVSYVIAKVVTIVPLAAEH